MLSIKKNYLHYAQYAVLFLSAVSILYPLLFVILASLKTDTEIFINPFGLPEAANWGIYKGLLVNKGFYVNVLNSLYYATSTMMVSALICFLGAYAITRMKWKLSGLFLAMLMIGIMVPENAMVLPLYVLLQRFGISNPRIALIFVFTAFSIPRTIFILTGFLQDVPRSIEEAAVIDGCSIWKVMFRIVFPLLKPAFATVCIFNFLQVWNDLFISLIFITANTEKTIQLGLLKFQGDHFTQYTILLAAVAITIIPIMIAYFIFQKNIIKGMTAGATKG